MSGSLLPYGLQHIRFPCPSLSPTVCSNSCPSSWWCHPTISSSVALFSSCPQSFPASQSFPVSWLFASGGQSIGASATASVLPVNIQGWFALGDHTVGSANAWFWRGVVFMNFQEIELIPIAKYITQSHGWAAAALLQGFQPQSWSPACPQISRPWRRTASPEEGKLFPNVLKGANTSLNHIPVGRGILRGYIFWFPRWFCVS